ncbi:GntR family transcriptional regulator [Xylanimonas allomyrinae]|uniref:GntR family transcriptional regulator n=1 Tax=Xylanimonas allomyrinae TaxID=2509459 RepID=A0A4P6EN42_9MICO|nr:GntR family transcriptional regulator [Xylanimonas allomyrinae]QAY63123.1 GntR family transcriptional regulator [Xylanimonas allomyrinae]
MSERIDRSSPLPFYFQLKEGIRASITDRGLRPGDRIEGDHELCALYGVSRTVVRQALAELETEGVIERVKGRGTFVAQPKTSEGLVQSLTGLFEDVAARGGHLRSAVRRVDLVPADERVADELGLQHGEPVIEIERLRFVDEEPWVLTVTHIPQALAPGLVHDDLTETSLYAILETKYGVTLAHGRRTVEAVAAKSSIAASLGVPEGAPVLLLRSVSFDADGRPVESFVAYHRGDRSRFEVELARSPRGPSRPMAQHVK